MNWQKYMWLLLFLFYVFVITFTIILPISMWGKPYSTFDLQSDNRENLKSSILQKNRQKERSSLRYISMLSKFDNLTAKNDCRLSVGVVTVSRMFGRNTLGYLTQVMHHIHKVSQETDTCIAICDVHAGPGNHTEARKMSQYFRTYTRFPEPSPSHVIMDVFEKEKEDYTYCLEQLQSHNSEEILILEDDAVPITDFYRKLRQVVKLLSNNNRNWGYLKLFYPPRWQGFSFEVQKLWELTLIGMAGSLLFLQIYIACMWIKNRSRVGVYVLTRILCLEAVVIVIFGFLYAMSIAMCVGRQNILEMYRDLGYYYTVTAPDCCSPAILYRRNVSQMLIDHFRKVKCSPHFPLDKALDSFRQDNGIEAYLVEPSLVWHIGLVSTLKGISRHLEEYTFYE